MCMYLDRTTYSWIGDFDGDDCYGHESDSRCVSIAEFTDTTATAAVTMFAIAAWWYGWKVNWDMVNEAMSNLNAQG